MGQIFSEENLRRLAEAVDLVAAAMAQVHLVRIHLEDLLLGEAVLQLKGDQNFDHLSLDALLRREKEILRQLLRKSRTSACLAMADHVGECAFGDAEVVNAAVLKEVPVFNCDDGLHHLLRNLIVGDEAALGAVLVFGERGDQLRFELIGAESNAILGSNALHYAVACVDRGSVGVVIAIRTRLDEDIVAVELVSPHLRVSVVSCAAKVGGDGVRG